jgi:hypothetical protein
MSAIFCGIGKMPKKSRRGTMRECAEKGQIRYYGIKKVDAKTIEHAKNKNTVPETREALIRMAASLKGLIRRNKTRCETTKNEDEKDNYCKIWKNAEKKLQVVIVKYNKLMAKRAKETEHHKAQAKTKKNKKSKKKKTGSKKKKAGSKKK